MEYKDFVTWLQLFAAKRPDLVLNTLSNIFTMRLIGNKTHGDLAEVGVSEFINQFLYDLGCIHVGKQFYRAKSQEEDIVVIDRIAVEHSANTLDSISTFCLLGITDEELEKRVQRINALVHEGIAVPVSLKAYGDGPLQLSTDKDSHLFTYLEQHLNATSTSDPALIQDVLTSEPFKEVKRINVMSFIYDETKKRCKIVVFDIERAFAETASVEYIAEGSGRKHPIYRFGNPDGDYIFEVRYGGKTANALQRGMWTHTRNALPYFIHVTKGEDGWISYEHNTSLVKLVALALNASRQGHQRSNQLLTEDIDALFTNNAN